jgi:type IX secretion system PorP/SprF family membrane protein
MSGMKKSLAIFVFRLICVCIPFLGRAQDPQLSQFYSAPLLISPAFAGINSTSKVNFNYRNQWPNLEANYQFTSFSADLSIGSINSGVGILATTDKQFANLKTTSLGLQYAYHIDLSPDQTLSLGMQGTYVSRGLDMSNLITGDQINNLLSGGSLGTSSDPLLSTMNNQRAYLDLSVGGLVNTRNYWIGFSAHHLNQPNKSLISSTEELLATKFSVQLGTKIILQENFYEADSYEDRNNEKSISPVIHYKQQGDFQQLDMGAYVTWSPMVFGLWYRGIPIAKSKLGTPNRESIVALLGYKQDNFSIGYSYDVTMSALGPAAGGAHELSLAYLFDFDFSLKKPFVKWKRNLSCPKF